MRSAGKGELWLNQKGVTFEEVNRNRLPDLANMCLPGVDDDLDFTKGDGSGAAGITD